MNKSVTGAPYRIKSYSLSQLDTKDKLQGSVATYLTCGGVVNNQIK